MNADPSEQPQKSAIPICYGQNTSRFDPIQGTHAPLFSALTARRVLLSIFLVYASLQVIYVCILGNQLTRSPDAYSEADVLRAADAYCKEGLAVSCGLPRQAYGKRFPNDGFRNPGFKSIGPDGRMILRLRKALPPEYADPNRWIYTHYPEGPDVILFLLGKVVGLNQLWLLRIFPLGTALAAFFYFFSNLTKAFGSDRAVFVAVGCALTPALFVFMPSFHYESYSMSLILLQMSFLIRIYWLEQKVLPWMWPAFFFIGFFQGWLSFDLFFVVALLAIPFHLLRQAENGESRSIFQLLLFMALPVAGFGLAHFLHLLQLAGVVGGVREAIVDFRSTATERTAGGAPLAGKMLPKVFRVPPFSILFGRTKKFMYVNNLLVDIYLYLKLTLYPSAYGFSPVFPAAFLSTLAALFPKAIRFSIRGFAFSWPECRSPLPLLCASLLISLLWLFAMPQHIITNSGETVRSLFVFSFFMLLVSAKSITRMEGGRSAGRLPG